MNDTLVHTVVSSPLGDLIVSASDAGLTGIHFGGQKYFPVAEKLGLLNEEHRVLRMARAQLDEYFAGNRSSFDLPLAPRGTEFQRGVWDALCAIAHGEVTSYAAIARSLGRATATRAVGGAIGRNPIAIVVPCHRVVGSNGHLTGFAAGLDLKTALLSHEGAAFAGKLKKMPPPERSR